MQVSTTYTVGRILHAKFHPHCCRVVGVGPSVGLGTVLLASSSENNWI